MATERRLLAARLLAARETNSPAETMALGHSLASRLRLGAVVAFFGDLGSGKTTMIKGVAAGLKVKDVVRSPSFVLATEYDGFVSGQPAKIYHIDLYRVSHPSELEEVGFSDYMRDDAITLIEWPDRAGTSLPADATRVELEVTGPQRRTIKISQATA